MVNNGIFILILHLLKRTKEIKNISILKDDVNTGVRDEFKRSILIINNL